MTRSVSDINVLKLREHTRHLPEIAVECPGSGKDISPYKKRKKKESYIELKIRLQTHLMLSHTYIFLFENGLR